VQSSQALPGEMLQQDTHTSAHENVYAEECMGADERTRVSTSTALGGTAAGRGWPVRYVFCDDDMTAEDAEFGIVAHNLGDHPWRDAYAVYRCSQRAGHLEDLGAQVLEHRREVHGRSRRRPHADQPPRELPLHTSNWKFEPGSRRCC
jgi:hypothetical protein